MPPIKITIQTAKHEFLKRLLWYLDTGMGEPSRRQAILTLSQILQVPSPTIQEWLSRQKIPSLWKLALSTLEREYGPPPEELLKDGKEADS